MVAFESITLPFEKNICKLHAQTYVKVVSFVYQTDMIPFDDFTVNELF
jgi:hypothetical protein